MKFNRNLIVKTSTLIASLAFGFVGPVTALAATAPSLGSLTPYAIVSSTFTNSNTSPQTIINGNVCDTTPPVTQPITTNGVTTTGGCPAQTGTDQLAALNNVTDGLNVQACTSLGTNIALDSAPGHATGVYTPGCYSTSGLGATSMTITTGATITLDGAGVYIFKSAGEFKPAANTSIVLTNGATADKVFWAPVGATTLGANVTFVGNILDAAGITMGQFSTLMGRALVFGGTLTTDSNTITAPAVLHVEKVVVGGSATVGSFTLHVKQAGVDVVPNGSHIGVATPGQAYALSAGTYTVSEDANSSYTTIISGVGCPSSGIVALVAGDNVTCTVTNTSIASPAPVAAVGGEYYNAPLPLINVTKVPNPLNLPGGAGSVTYTYVATNLGKVAMDGVWVRDDKCTDVKFISGDTNSNSLLDINETWTYTCTKVVSKTETNVATAHGSANGWDGYDTAVSTVAVGVKLTPPLIHLVKTPDKFVLPAGGGAVTYSYAITNPGVVPMNDISITDDKCTGLPIRIASHAGDVNKNSLLDPGETWHFTCQTNITQTTTNTGTAIGHANGFVAVDLSPATVAVAAPSLPNTGVDNGGISWGVAIISGIVIALAAFLIGKKQQIVV